MSYNISGHPSCHVSTYDMLDLLVLLLFSIFRVKASLLKHILQDAIELDQLISYLINKEDSEGVVLLGHSTGCQVNLYCLSFFTFPFYFF